MARGTATRTGPRPARWHLPNADADHVRELRARAQWSAQTADAPTGGHDRGGERDPAARAAADLPGCVWLSGVRASGGAARTGPLHPRARRSADRRRVPLHRLAVSELPLRPAVHAPRLCDRTAGSRRRPVGVQGDRRRVESRCGGADRAGGHATRPVGEVGDRVRGTQSGDAGTGRGRRPQRHAAGPGTRYSPFADRGNR